MISFDEAIALVRSVARPLGTETLPIAEAAGRVLAEAVVAQLDSPRADVSAMDGYAVRDSDLVSLPARLGIAGESFAGAGWGGTVAAGSCARIFTGAPVPAGADRVVIQENVRRDGDDAIIAAASGAERHIRMRGSDFAAGDELLPAGTRLSARALVTAAAADLAQVEVFRRPKLHILSTGDELAEPGTARQRADAVPDSVSLGVAALARDWGAECTGYTRLRDELGPMQSAAVAAIESADIVVVTGGASIGERDFAKAMFEPLGLQLLFSKVAIRPGKPVWLGIARDRLLLGLPGNPTSGMVTGRLLLAPLLVGIGGQPIGRALRWRRVPLAAALVACGERETFHRARLTDNGAEILPYQDSSAQRALAEADLLVRQRANSPAIAAATEVEVLDF